MTLRILPSVLRLFVRLLSPRESTLEKREKRKGKEDLALSTLTNDRNERSMRIKGRWKKSPLRTKHAVTYRDFRLSASEEFRVSDSATPAGSLSAINAGTADSFARIFHARRPLHSPAAKVFRDRCETTARKFSEAAVMNKKRDGISYVSQRRFCSSFLPPSRQRKNALIFRLDPYFFSRAHAREDLEGLWKVTPKSTDKYPYIPVESILPRDKTESVGSSPASAGDSSGIRNFPHFAGRGSHPRTGAATCGRAALQLKCGPAGAAACRFRKASFLMSRRISDRRNPRESVQRAEPYGASLRDFYPSLLLSLSLFVSLSLSIRSLFRSLPFSLRRALNTRT